MIDLFPNDTLIIQWVIFMVVLATLHFGIFRPTLKILRERKLHTEGQLQKAKELKHKSQELMDQCDAKLGEARLKGNVMREHLLKEGEGIFSKVVQEARETEEAKINQVRQEIESHCQQIVVSLQKSAREMAQDVVQIVLGRKI